MQIIFSHESFTRKEIYTGRPLSSEFQPMGIEMSSYKTNSLNVRPSFVFHTAWITHVVVSTWDTIGF